MHANVSPTTGALLNSKGPGGGNSTGGHFQLNHCENSINLTQTQAGDTVSWPCCSWTRQHILHVLWGERWAPRENVHTCTHRRVHINRNKRVCVYVCISYICIHTYISLLKTQIQVWCPHQHHPSFPHSAHLQSNKTNQTALNTMQCNINHWFNVMRHLFIPNFCSCSGFYMQGQLIA